MKSKNIFLITLLFMFFPAGCQVIKKRTLKSATLNIECSLIENILNDTILDSLINVFLRVPEKEVQLLNNTIKFDRSFLTENIFRKKYDKNYSSFSSYSPEAEKKLNILSDSLWKKDFYCNQGFLSQKINICSKQIKRKTDNYNVIFEFTFQKENELMIFVSNYSKSSPKYTWGIIYVLIQFGHEKQILNKYYGVSQS